MLENGCVGVSFFLQICLFWYDMGSCPRCGRGAHFVQDLREHMRVCGRTNMGRYSRSRSMPPTLKYRPKKSMKFSIMPMARRLNAAIPASTLVEARAGQQSISMKNGVSGLMLHYHLWFFIAICSFNCKGWSYFYNYLLWLPFSACYRWRIWPTRLESLQTFDAMKFQEQHTGYEWTQRGQPYTHATCTSQRISNTVALRTTSTVLCWFFVWWWLQTKPNVGRHWNKTLGAYFSQTHRQWVTEVFVVPKWPS